jgi:hypothetical protein
LIALADSGSRAVIEVSARANSSPGAKMVSKLMENIPLIQQLRIAQSSLSGFFTPVECTTCAFHGMLPPRPQTSIKQPHEVIRYRLAKSIRMFEYKKQFLVHSYQGAGLNQAG